MHRRQSTKSKSDLHRRKSTTSVRSVHLEHINPQLAQRDAQVAASQAFARGRERLSVELPLFPPPAAPSPTRGPVGPRSLVRSDNSIDGCSDMDHHEIRRQQSVRFVGPSSAGGPQSRMGKAVGTRTGNKVNHTQAPAIPSRDTIFKAHPSASLGESRSQHSFNLASLDERKPPDQPLDTLTQSYINALAAGEQYFTPFDDIAYAPSSYRRLRKSRSTLATTYFGSRRSETTGTLPSENNDTFTGLPYLLSTSKPSLLRRWGQENDKPSSSVQAPLLRAPKSMSFLRGRRSRTTSAMTHESEEATLEPVPESNRDINVQQPALRQKPSFFFGSVKESRGAGMRKSLRSSSSQSAMPLQLSKSSISLAGSVSLRTKARKVSTSLKSKLKRLFQISRPKDDGGLPNQHIEAYGTDFHLKPVAATSAADAMSFNGEASLSQVNYRVPSLHRISSIGGHEALHGSLESLQCERDGCGEKSRVTSWTSSGNTTAAGQEQDWREWEKQRLSIIKERGTHAPSPSLKRPHLRELGPESSHDTNQSKSETPLGACQLVDSQRVYSALMKRLDETKQLASIVEHQRQSSTEMSDPFRTLSPASSIGQTLQAKSETTPMTIRCIGSQDKNPWIDRDKAQSNTLQQEEFLSGRARRELLDEIRGRQGSPSATTESSCGTAPGQTVDGNCTSPKTQISLVPSFVARNPAFFGSPECHTFRTESPYRRALREAIRTTDHLVKPLHDDSSLRQMSPGNYAEGSRVAYSESAYSDDVPDDAQVQQGAASTSYESALSRGQPWHQHRVESSTSSQDWKTLLAATFVDQSERVRSRANHTTEQSKIAFPTSGIPLEVENRHFRECAQTYGGEDDDRDSQIIPDHCQTPASPLALVEPNVVTSPHRPTPVRKATPLPAGLLPENSVPSSSFSDLGRKPPAPPPIPNRSAQRPEPPEQLTGARSLHDLRAHFGTQTKTFSKGQTMDKARRTKSLARIRSITKTRASETGSPNASETQSTRFMKRTGRLFGGATTPSTFASATSSPGLTAAVERQFGRVSNGVVEATNDDKENKWSEVEASTYTDTQGTGLLGPEIGAQAMGSKQMVDIFLSSRRRRVAGSDETGAFI